MKPKSNPSPTTEEIRECLQRTVQTELERKSRLGQYAVIWKDGKVHRIEPKAEPIVSTKK